jgi:hypothetical protein
VAAQRQILTVIEKSICHRDLGRQMMSYSSLTPLTRRKFGEILLATDKPASPMTNALLLAARLPGFVFLNLSSGGINNRTTHLTGHTPLFTFPPKQPECRPEPEPTRPSATRQSVLNL